MKTTFGILLLLLFILPACIPENMKQQMSQGLRKSQEMMADMNFKHAINNIELHKLRTGAYPDSLSQIEFTTEFDRGSASSVEYRKLDSGYELNNVACYQGMNGKPGDTIRFDYPAEFWQGLGCTKSNLKK